MPLSYRELTPPIVEPVTLALAKQQCVVDESFIADDLYIGGLITGARQYVEKLTNRAIYNRTMALYLDFFPFPDYGSTINPNDRHVLYGSFWHQLAIKLPKPRALSVQSITYVDLTNATQTLDPSTYFVDVNSEPARIVPMPGLYWPYTQSYLPGSITIDFTTGTYGDGMMVDTCPMTIKQAILLLVSHWYSNRDAATATPPKAIDLGVTSLLAGEIFDSFV